MLPSGTMDAFYRFLSQSFLEEEFLVKSAVHCQEKRSYLIAKI